MTTVDERGRVLLPKDVREAHGLTPGSPVIVESGPDGVLLRAALPKEEALRRLKGAINKRTKCKDAPLLDPLEAKRIWEPRF